MKERNVDQLTMPEIEAILASLFKGDVHDWCSVATIPDAPAERRSRDPVGLSGLYGMIDQGG